MRKPASIEVWCVVMFATWRCARKSPSVTIAKSGNPTPHAELSTVTGSAKPRSTVGTADSSKSSRGCTMAA